MSVAVEQFRMVAAHAQPGDVLEIRTVATGDRRVEQHFKPAAEPERAAAIALALADTHDVYFGCLPRRRRRGRGQDCSRAGVLWADLDTPEAVARMADVAAPSLLLASGTPGHAHAFWGLREPLDPRWVRRGTLRLAHALGADTAACDTARVLRVAETRAHKTTPAAEVRCLDLDPERSYRIRELVGGLPDPPERRPQPATATITQGAVDAAGDLRTIPPSAYVPALTGRAPKVAGYVTCPFHQGMDGAPERTPSLRLYDRDWFCFGCCRGGSIIDFGRYLYGIEPYGAGYFTVVSRLRSDLRGAP